MNSPGRLFISFLFSSLKVPSEGDSWLKSNWILLAAVGVHTFLYLWKGTLDSCPPGGRGTVFPLSACSALGSPGSEAFPSSCCLRPHHARACRLVTHHVLPRLCEKDNPKQNSAFLKLTENVQSSPQKREYSMCISVSGASRTAVLALWGLGEPSTGEHVVLFSTHSHCSRNSDKCAV